MLPKGTILYFDKAYPEGFTRYKVYINIDRMPLTLQSLSDSTTIIPIEGHVPYKEDLKKLLREYPLTRSDLADILKSQHLTKDEISEVFKEYLR